MIPILAEDGGDFRRGHGSMLRSSQSATIDADSGASRQQGFSRIDGEPHACIRDVDRLPPFLMNVVGNGDAWLFAGSNGGLTAGRRDPDWAVFPYQTVDKILATPTASGAVTILRIGADVWEPFVGPKADGRRRHLHKHQLGAEVVFEELDEPLRLRFRARLAPCDAFGLVRRCSIKNVGSTTRSIRILDGWHRLQPPGVTQATFERYSYLAAAYMRHELLPVEGLLVAALNAAITDRPEPAESLRAAVAWSVGHRAPRRTIAPSAIQLFRTGADIPIVRDVRGEYGCYLVEDEVTLEPGESIDWTSVVDTALDHAAVVQLRRRLADPDAAAAAVRTALEDDTRGLRRRVAAGDGLQDTADRAATLHHASNTLFNVLRGGIPVAGHRCPAGDVARFVCERNRIVHHRHRDWLETLGDVDLVALPALAAGRGDPQLERLCGEYLPIGFGRRHGDPSRPWNRFSIATRSSTGESLLSYSGNWRDIFQNWEALAHSHPACLPGMIAVFLNASTADGYNPYRISREGVDWEVENPADPWSHIGYWGDHQIVYLLRLLEAHERFWPGTLAADLDRRRHASVDLPYAIAGFDDLLQDPRHSIRFDHEQHAALMSRRATIGGDGALVVAADGEPRLVSFLEKLLVPMLVKLTNLVPGGGIWLNTQRPEWNDANNALAGWGLSVVTVCHLRRYLDFIDGLLSGSDAESFALTEPVAELMEGLLATLAEQPSDDALAVFTALGRAGERHRRAVRAGGTDATRQVARATVQAVLAAARDLVDATIRTNLRDDGLAHSYNRLEVRGQGLVLHRLDLMLEGQVAALSSGCLTDDEAVRLLDALRSSSLFRGDQRSYLLQPDRPIPSYLERNRLPADWAARCPALAARVQAGATDIVVVDADGGGRFHADLANARDLAARLEAAEIPAGERPAVLAVWEDVFRHDAFTGRSGSFFAFEGLGSIYWHMVAKLQLAVQECHARAAGAARSQLLAHYRAVRDGLGFRKTAEEYGAFPTDAYSHTPRHAGAQQPGMTGQVKEAILARLVELGVLIEAGGIRFRPDMLDRHEGGEGGDFHYVDVHGVDRVVAVPSGGLAFTLCQVPVIYAPADAAAIALVRADGSVEAHAGTEVPRAACREVFLRSGAVAAIRVGVTGLAKEGNHDERR
jgi:hypothetical protein